ncbi:uncharacterized protein LOC111365919 isoform X2 [Olea europaea var. sylvestris]|uniref:uncharacterized protein LOC111365919 isoform X2 n=1 Tax=Olea europaea var. sylvestris TaxID=158386 RepID=UPI000C1CDE82|nr:uncharacterized protein LOC111365919 isoform X2 [Olea europaea var. sylvestris]
MEAKIANFEVPTIEHVSQLPLGAMKTIGTQNYYNAAVAALSVGLDLGINDAAIYSTIGNLRAPPHRMVVVHKDSHRITWVDDSKATNVDAMYAGLMVLKELKAVVLLGGLAKASDVQGSNGFEQLVEPLKYHRGVITLRMMIQNALSSNGLSIPCVRARDLKDAVRLMKTMAKTGDAILLSPGCASFDEFRNFKHRGGILSGACLLNLSVSIGIFLCYKPKNYKL